METTAIETSTTSGATAATQAAGWASQSAGEKLFSLMIFGVSTVVTAAFAYYLFTDPTRLPQAWEWSRSLPLAFQALVWLLFLPWMIALWIWTSPWAFAVRIVLVIAILVFTEYLMYPFK